MTGEQQWKLAWSKLDAIRGNPPSEIDDGLVQEYHEALGLLRESSGEDVGPFEIPANRLRPKSLGGQRVGWSGRGGMIQYHPTKKVCDRNFFTRQLEALYAYFASPAPNAEEQSGAPDAEEHSSKKYGF
jgi:hypothetical protein